MKNPLNHYSRFLIYARLQWIKPEAHLSRTTVFAVRKWLRHSQPQPWKRLAEPSRAPHYCANKIQPQLRPGSACSRPSASITNSIQRPDGLYLGTAEGIPDSRPGVVVPLANDLSQKPKGVLKNCGKAIFRSLSASLHC